MELVEDVDVDTVCSKNVRCDLSELWAVVTAVERDTYAERSLDLMNYLKK